jgi:hypothetical protein
VQDLLKYDPQQRPSCSQTLQYPFFQVDSTLPPPSSTAVPQQSTFTRRPVGKSETELRFEQEQADREEKERLAQDNQTQVNPSGPNLLHQGAPPRSESTFVQSRLVGAPIKGPPSNIHPSDLIDDDDEDKDMAQFMGEVDSVASSASPRAAVGKETNTKPVHTGVTQKPLGDFGRNNSGNAGNAGSSEKGTGVLGGFPSKPQPFGSNVNSFGDEFGEAAGSR